MYAREFHRLWSFWTFFRIIHIISFTQIKNVDSGRFDIFFFTQPSKCIFSKRVVFTLYSLERDYNDCFQNYYIFF